jgi:hypothetical protein
MRQMKWMARHTSGEAATPNFDAKGYDCSGAVSYALDGVDLLEDTIGLRPAGRLRKPPARQVDHHLCQRKHVLMVVTQLHFDTGNGPEQTSGSPLEEDRP